MCGSVGIHRWKAETLPGCPFSNAAYTRSTAASSDGELYTVTEGGSGAVGDGDLHLEQPGAPGSRVHHVCECHVGVLGW